MSVETMGKKRLRNARVHQCGRCHGSAVAYEFPPGSRSSEDGIEIRCPECNGQGWVVEKSPEKPVRPAQRP